MCPCRAANPRKHGPPHGDYFNVHQHVALQEVRFEKRLKDDVQLNPAMHTADRIALGRTRWLQSSSISYWVPLSHVRRAAKDSSPTIGDVRAIIRTIESIPRDFGLLRVRPD